MKRKPATTFRELIVWQKAHEFVLGVYRLTRSFPREEIYCLTPQFRRAAISMPANIAEGFRKRSRADKARYMNIAEGSLDECRYYLILADDLSYGDASPLHSLLDEVSKLLSRYIAALMAPNS